MCVPASLDEASIAAFRRIADAIHSGPNASRTMALMQLSHAGRQSPRILSGRSIFKAPLGASTVPMVSRSKSAIGDLMFWLSFHPPREATDADIEEVIDSFVRGAQLAHLSGVRSLTRSCATDVDTPILTLIYSSQFDGIQLHCSHGCKPYVHLPELEIMLPITDTLHRRSSRTILIAKGTSRTTFPEP